MFTLYLCFSAYACNHLFSHTCIYIYTPATQPLDAGIVMSNTHGIAKKATAVAVRVIDSQNLVSLR